MEAKYIDLSDYRRSGEGANGASYDCISDPSYMVKLYNKDYPVHTIYSEQEVARKVYALGIPSPEPGEIVTDGECIGIRFRRVDGKRSFSRAFADEAERVEPYAREFARMCKNLHNTHCPDGLFPDAKQQFLDLLDADKTFGPAEHEVLAGFIKSAPDCKTALHGDMHFGNALTTLPKGAPLDSVHETYFIDLGYFAQGCPLFDMGMLYNICLIADEDFRQHDFHEDGKLTEKVWKYFVDEYFFAEDCIADKMFGSGQTAETVSGIIAKYSAVKLLLVEYNLGFMPPGYIKFIRETFNL